MLNRYEIPGIDQSVVNLLVTETGLVYITTGEGVYEYNIGYKQLTKLPLSIDGRETGTIFIDKYDKIWFQEGNNALVYYDPLNKPIAALHFLNRIP